MNTRNANDGKITIYDANGQIVSVIAKDSTATPRWASHRDTVKGVVLDAHGNPASVTVPVTHDKSGHGPVTVHDDSDKATIVDTNTRLLQGDHKGNPYTARAAYDEGTSGEGKANGALYKFRKSTLQCALFQLHGKAFDLNGKVKHVSAMNKDESVQLLQADKVTVLCIEAMIYYLAPITE